MTSNKQFSIKKRPFLLGAMLAPVLAVAAFSNAAASGCHATAEPQILNTSGIKFEVRFHINHDAPDKASGAVRYTFHYNAAGQTDASGKPFQTSTSTIVLYNGKRDGEAVIGRHVTAFDIGRALYVEIDDVTCRFN